MKQCYQFIKILMMPALLLLLGQTAYAMESEIKERSALETIEKDLPNIIKNNNVNGMRDYIIMLDVNPNRTINNVPLLIYAIKMGRPKIATLLLELGADANVIDAQGISALEHAQKSGYLDIAQQLKEYGAQSAKRTKRNFIRSSL